ncbi:MAG TPA: ATP-binding protein [Terriglobales bacterium]|nr:ATP-binding protein [Terriglobales bacterium]
MKNRVFLKLLLAFVVVVLSATIVLDLSIRHFWRESLTREIERSLLTSARQFEVSLGDRREASGLVQQHAKITGARITLIDKAGIPFADSEGEIARMGDHSQRPEFAAALAGKIGTAQRHSETLGADFLYVAIPSQTGATRFAYPLRQITLAETELRKQMFWATLIALVIGTVIAGVIARVMSERLRRLMVFADQIAAGDYSGRVKGPKDDELGQVALQLESTARKLRESSTEMERVEKTRRDFIANVSHELRTPLTSIKGFTETMLESGSLPEEQQSFLKIISKHTSRMTRLTDDLLVLARVESREEHFVRENIPVSEILEEARSSGTATIHGRKIQVEEIAPRAVYADPEAIHRVFLNLIENAVKSSGPGIPIEIGAREVQDGIQFYVRDNGSGIAPEHHDRVFERFYRIDSSRSSDSGGTGLGLAIVKHIVLAHGGSIGLQSQLGAGSTFYFVLPLAA